MADMKQRPAARVWDTDPAILSELASLALHMARTKSSVPQWLDRVKEEWNERAAIRQHLGAMSPLQAERYALGDTIEQMNTLNGHRPR